MRWVSSNNKRTWGHAYLPIQSNDWTSTPFGISATRDFGLLLYGWQLIYGKKSYKWGWQKRCLLCWKSQVPLFCYLWSFRTSFLCSYRMSNKLELLRSLYKESRLCLDSILQEVHHLYRVKYIRDKSLQTFNYTYLILCRYQSRWYKWSYN